MLDTNSLYSYVTGKPLTFIDPEGNEIVLPDGEEGPTDEGPGRALVCANGHLFIRVFAYKTCANNGCDCGAGKKGCVDLHFDIVQGAA